MISKYDNFGVVEYSRFIHTNRFFELSVKDTNITLKSSNIIDDGIDNYSQICTTIANNNLEPENSNDYIGAILPGLIKSHLIKKVTKSQKIVSDMIEIEPDEIKMFKNLEFENIGTLFNEQCILYLSGGSHGLKVCNDPTSRTYTLRILASLYGGGYYDYYIDTYGIPRIRDFNKLILLSIINRMYIRPVSRRVDISTNMSSMMWTFISLHCDSDIDCSESTAMNVYKKFVDTLKYIFGKSYQNGELEKIGELIK